MGLEQRIEELTKAVVTLTEVVLRTAENPPVAAPAKVADAAPAAKRTAAPPAAEPVAETVTDAAPAEAAPALTYQDLMKALTELGKSMKAAGKAPGDIRQAGIDCLARVGAEKLPDIKEKPETWPRLIEVIERVKAGGEP